MSLGPRMSNIASIKPVRTSGKLCEVVRAEIEKLILAGKLKVNEQLPTENDLCKAFGVSRTVVREAIQRLEAQGLVQARVGSGSYVVPFQLDEIKSAMLRYGSLNPEPQTYLHMLDLRTVIECENAARVAQEPPAELLRELRELLVEMHALVRSPEASSRRADRLMQADMAFHMSVARATGNPFFSAILEPLKHLLSSYAAGIYRPVEDLIQTYDEHAAIVDAVEARDPERARAAMRRHIDQSRSRFITFMKAAPQPQPSPTPDPRPPAGSPGKAGRSSVVRLLIASLACLLTVTGARADVRLPNALGSNMVLQRDVPATVWGAADPAESVVVRFAGQERRTVADDKGRWSVTLDPLPASTEGRELVIEGKNVIRLTDVLVGDVWVCSGQSNMEYPVRRPEKYRGPPAGTPDLAAEALAAGRHEGLRLLKVQKVLSPGDLTTDGWQTAEGEALAKFSAPAFFFGKDIFRETGVPLGLIDVSWGGTRIEVWTDVGVYDRYPEIGAPTTRPLFVEGSPVGRQYDRMVRPLTPMRVKGFLWYQGESNVIIGETARYTPKFRALIESWRTAFNAADAPFYFVQLAPYAYNNRKQEPKIPTDALPEFREAQAAVLSLPRTGMVATTDLVDNLGDIHPWNKWVVGQRLALFALARDYGKTDINPESPRMTGIEADGSGAIVTFTHVGKGLSTSDGKPPAEFTVAGADGKFVPATAELLPGGRVRLSAPGVETVHEVRYAWHERARTNLQNAVGLPALPFRSAVR